MFFGAVGVFDRVKSVFSLLPWPKYSLKTKFGELITKDPLDCVTTEIDPASFIKLVLSGSVVKDPDKPPLKVDDS